MTRSWVLATALLAGCNAVFSTTDPPTPICLDETFDGPTLDPARWRVNTAAATPNVRIVQQGVEITLPSQTLDYYGITTTETFDLTAGEIVVEVVRAVDQAGRIENLIDLRSSDLFVQYKILTGNNNIRFRVVFDDGNDGPNNTDSTPVNRPFDPVNQRVWRLRHDASTNTIHYGYGPDVDSITDGLSIAVLREDVSTMRLSLLAGAYSTATLPGVAIYDNLTIRGGCPR